MEGILLICQLTVSTVKIYDTFDHFWHDYFSGQPNTQASFDAWTIAHFTHTSDEEYQQLRLAGKDSLGYQPTLLTLADPLNQENVEVIVKNMSDTVYHSLRGQYQQRFIEQLPNRFGLFHAESQQADAIYDSWEQFAQAWLTNEGQNVLKYNLPLSFDHVSDIDYWAWQQKGFDPCGTQRLIVTIFQYRTGRFAEIFVTGVTDAEMSRIALLMRSQLTLQAEELF